MITQRPDGRKGLLISEHLYYSLAGFIYRQIMQSEKATLTIILHEAAIEFAETPNIDLITFHVKLHLECLGYISGKKVNGEKGMTQLKVTKRGAKYFSKNLKLDLKISKTNQKEGVGI